MRDQHDVFGNDVPAPHIPASIGVLDRVTLRTGRAIAVERVPGWRSTTLANVPLPAIGDRSVASFEDARDMGYLIGVGTEAGRDGRWRR
jgi:hypothetical protein